MASCNPTDSTAYSGTIGLPVSSTDMCLLDDDGNEVPAGGTGEIAIRGPQVMAGYWQRPDETAKVMTPDAYFRTGDIGVVDERGYFRIVDRKKDMILVSGFNVYPNEIEDVLTQMPGVLEAAAVGVPDAKGGRGGQGGHRQEEPGPDRGRGARLLRGQPDRLQAAKGGGVPHRAAEDERRQDPAPRAAGQDLTPGARLSVLDQRYRKTDAGRAEIKARSLTALSRGGRSLLLMLDGSRTAREWLAMVNGATRADLELMLAHGLVAALAGAAGAGPGRGAGRCRIR